MTRRIGRTVVIETEPKGRCAYCGSMRELRPYGRNGARICHRCGSLPENRAETERQMDARLSGGAHES